MMKKAALWILAASGLLAWTGLVTFAILLGLSLVRRIL